MIMEMHRSREQKTLVGWVRDQTPGTPGPPFPPFACRALRAVKRLGSARVYHRPCGRSPPSSLFVVRLSCFEPTHSHGGFEQRERTDPVSGGAVDATEKRKMERDA